MKKKNKVTIRLLTSASLMIGVLLIQTPARAEGAENKTGLPLADLRAFAEIFGRVKSDYVEPVKDKALLRYAIRGMLNGLDPHSAYLAEDEFNELKVGTTGEFGGLGIEVGVEDGYVQVISPIDDTPAQRAGVKAGDIIIRLDGKPLKGLTLDEAVKKMRGKPGTGIVLTITRKGLDKPLDITVVRDIIKVASVKHRMLDPGFGYVRLTHFQSRTPEDLLKATSKLTKKAGGRLSGLVLDLRNNPGGVLSAAVAVSDAFLRKGIIVYTEGRVKDSQLKFSAAQDDVLDGAPLVVLVNGGSASASEIVAGALQDHKRAVIMGRLTFGKGSVQTIIPINEKTAIKLTTARYFTPSGRSIQAEGIKPDIVLDSVKLTTNQKAAGRLVKESDLKGHLENPVNGGSDKTKGNRANAEKQKKSLAEEDYELNEALNLLKGLAILRPQS